MSLDTRSAALLIECARRGSLGRAAAALKMTQPAVTRGLKLLEDSYGVPLFDRTTRGVVPTPFGEALLPYAQLIVSEIGNARDVIEQMKGASRGVVRVGGVASVVGSFIVSAIADARKAHPDIQFQIVEELEDRLLDGLKSGSVDLALSPEPYSDDEITLATTDTLHDKVSTYAATGHPLLRMTPMTLAMVAQADWALPPIASPVGREWLRRFHSRAIEPKLPGVVSRSVHVIKSAVMADQLLCWMPLPLVAEEVERGAMVRIQVPELEWSRKFRIYQRRKGLLSPGAAILVDALRRIAQAMPDASK